MATPETRTANELAAERTDLASMRTQMAADRSLMAWVRTALSMISFGFTIYKFLQALQAGGTTVIQASPRTIGLFLIGMGTLSMLAGLIEYRQTLVYLGRQQYPAIRRPSFIIALILTAVGTFMFVTVFARLL